MSEMSIPKLVPLSNPLLHRKAQAVNVSEIKDQRFQLLLDNLVIAMRYYKGVGIAAPQIGITKQIFVCEVNKNIRYPDAPDIPLQIYLNPHLTHVTSEVVILQEGCLSVRHLRADVPRAQKVRLSALNRYGEIVGVDVEGFQARIFQHECDHLNGRLFLERVRDFSTVVKIRA